MCVHTTRACRHPHEPIRRALGVFFQRPGHETVTWPGWGIDRQVASTVLSHLARVSNYRLLASCVYTKERRLTSPARLAKPLFNSFSFCFILTHLSDGLMTYADFVALCRTLFRNEQGKAYAIEENRMQEMFQVFDDNSVMLRLVNCRLATLTECFSQDGYIDFQEFAFCWKQWIKPVSACT